jgi:threonine dehydrogenase-like Zn-dependent dehydrogenase
MKAAVLREPKTPLVIEDVPRPTIEAGDVLIRVEACGVCHSDLHVAEGDWKQFAGINGGTGNVFNHQRRFEFAEYGCFHFSIYSSVVEDHTPGVIWCL